MLGKICVGLDLEGAAPRELVAYVEDVRVEDLPLTDEERSQIMDQFDRRYGALVRETAGRVLKEYRLVQGILSRSPMWSREDLEQELVVAVYRKAPYFILKGAIDETRNVSNYFYSFMRNRLVDLYRQVQRTSDRAVVSLDDPSLSLDASVSAEPSSVTVGDAVFLLLMRVLLLERLLSDSDPDRFRRYLSLWAQVKLDYVDGQLGSLEGLLDQLEGVRDGVRSGEGS